MASRVSRRDLVKGATGAAIAGLASPAVAGARGGHGHHGHHGHDHGGPLGPATIAARRHYFGPDNVDPRTGRVRDDRVLLSWTGEAGFAAAFYGRVVLLDAWVSRGASISMSYVGSTPDELAALKPELVFTGHNHFDHVGDLPAVIRANPGITVFDSAEGCADIKAAVPDVPFTAFPVFPAGAPLASVASLSRFLPGVGLTAVKHPHSGATPGETPIQAPDDDIAQQQYPPAPDEPPSYTGPTSGSISILYQFRLGSFGLLWHNTSGPENADVLRVLSELRRSTDVEIGSIVSAGGNGIQDCGRYTAALEPEIFIPIHGDNFPRASRMEYYRKPLQESLNSLAKPPMLWFICNPGDYLRPLSFDPRAAAWRG
jgi:L-ascorbate metabolism protein UlaG (beta-lactamase superfamily)